MGLNTRILEQATNAARTQPSVLTLVAVFILIASRQIGGLKLHIWQIMLLGALTVLLTGQISPYDGLKSINMDVM